MCAADIWIRWADYLPLYFQAVKSHSPLNSGVDMLELSLTVTPVAYVPASAPPPLLPTLFLLITCRILTGISVAVFNRYRLQSYIGWLISIAGFSLLSIIKAETHGVWLAGLQLPAAVGVGILYSAVTFSILAPLTVEQNAHALAFFMFVRTFSYVSNIPHPN
jgi:hypothetical protein